MLEDKVDWTYKKALFRYGMPCVEDRIKLGIISHEDYDKLCSYIGKEDDIPEELLNKHFKQVVDNINEKTGEGIDEYFFGKHNHQIENKEGNYANYPEHFCQACKAIEGLVSSSEKDDKGKYKIKISENKVVKALPKYSGEVNSGDKVIIHRGYIIKILK
jgi:hypothetical protein